MTKPLSEASERNKQPILDVLRDVFSNVARVLEIGSGTGQHAVYFAAALPHLVWQPADLEANHAGIEMWRAEAGLPNVPAPRRLDALDRASWPSDDYDAVFSANTLHIMSWPAVEACFELIGQVLAPGGVLAIYGPFNYGGDYTSASNRQFDAWLKGRDPLSGIRDFEAVDALARAQGLALVSDLAMPANNRTLIWRRAPL